LTQIDSALGLAFLDIKVAFEIVVFRIFGDFSKRAQSNWDFGFGRPMEFTGKRKTNMCTGEIDPRNIGRGIEIRRGVKMRTDKIGGSLERAAREIGLANETRVRKRNG
jgi:hypothetical protein